MDDNTANKGTSSNSLNENDSFHADKVTGNIFSPDLIQIKAADEDEVFRRINAFIRNKRLEVDERNIREFISPATGESDTSCARTEAVYFHREGEKSHITLKRVDNLYGPQTRLAVDDDASSELHRNVPLDIQRAEAVEERLRNMETHANVTPENNNIYSRIKALEERINYLEGISPEYFTNGIPLNKSRTQVSSTEETKPLIFKQNQGESLNDLNRKISQLRQALKHKTDYISHYND